MGNAAMLRDGLPPHRSARYQKRALPKTGQLDGGKCRVMADFADTTSAGIASSAPHRAASIEGRGSWIAAGVTLALLSVSYGSPLLVVVGPEPITEGLGTAPPGVAPAGALTWLRARAGGIPVGRGAQRTRNPLPGILRARGTRRGAAHRARAASEYRTRDHLHRGVLLLCSDGDPPRPSRRLLQRYRNPGGAGCGDAVGPAGCGFYEPHVLGLAQRPDRRGVGSGCLLGLPGTGGCGVFWGPRRRLAFSPRRPPLGPAPPAPPRLPECHS